MGRSYRLEVPLKGRGWKIRGYGKVAKRRPFSEVIDSTKEEEEEEEEDKDNTELAAAQSE